MSLNQSRTEKSEPSQSRKSGRSGSSNQQRNFSGGPGKGGGGAGRGSAPPSNQSFKKVNNAQGGQARAPGATQNGAPSQPLQATVAEPVSNVTVKQSEPISQRSNRNVPKAPSSNAAVPTTPAKAPGDPSASFPLQFGSLSPGLMNGMQIPARTSSAPPNLDEQKRDQARNDAPRSIPGLPTPSIPKQHLPIKEVGQTTKSTPATATAAPEVHHPVPKQKRDSQAPAAAQQPAAAPQIQKLPPQVHSIPGISIQMPPFHHQQPPPVQFAGATPQGSMSMPMPIPRANPSQQQVYVHQLPGIMHQGPNLNFSSQMGPPQLSNVNLNIPQNFQSPQQTGQFSGQRKSIVKITHPDTHEELRLDSGSTGQRPHPNLPTQTQPIQSFPSNFYPGSFNPNPLFFQATSLPISSSQVTPGSQNQQRFYTQGPQSVPFTNQTARNLFSGSKGAEPVQVTVKPAVHSSSILVTAPAVKITSTPPVIIKDSASAVTSSSSTKSTSVNKPELVHSHRDSEVLSAALPVLSKPSLPAVSAETIVVSAPSATSRDSSLVANNVEGVKVEISDKLDCIKDDDDKKINKNEGAAQSTVSQILPTPKLEHSGSFSGQHSKNVEANMTPASESDHTEEKLPTSVVSDEHVSVSKSVSPTCANEETKLEISAPEIISRAEVTKESDQNCESAPSATSKSSDAVNENLDNNAAELLESVSEKVEEQEPLESSKEEDEAGTLEASSSNIDLVVGEEVAVAESEPLSQDSTLSDPTAQDQDEGTKDKALPEPNRGKGDNNTAGSKKKKRKEALLKANAQGNTSDLYNAYKNPEEKKENATSVSEPAVHKPVPDNTSREEESDEKSSEDNEGEPDDWEDAAEITPKLETSDKDADGITGTKYSRDFLLKFCDLFTDLPEGFAVAQDFYEVMTSSTSNVNNPREYPSPGRNFDGPPGGPRLDRRHSGLGEDDRWNRVPGPLNNNVPGYRQGQGGNFGVLRGHPRGGVQTPVHYNTGGILSGPMQSGPQRNMSDSDRWQRAKGLIQSPQTPLQVMHRAERKYEVGKITDEEQAKQRQLKGILNKLTPQNFEKLFEQVKQVNIDNAGTLTGVISQIFDKALMEPTFCEMYANFCYSLSGELPDFVEDNEKITFKRLLLNKCQEEFERGEREQEEANRAEEEGELKQTEEEREEKRIQARRRMLGNIRLIGELYKKKMLTERIMHECIKKLLGQYQTPDEEDVESLCKLMSTIGEMIDHPKAKEHMDVYFDMMNKLSNNMKLSSRVRFMLKDSIDLRKNKWQQRRKIEGPKKIEDVHRDAAQERHAQTSRLARGGGSHMSQPARRGQLNMDYGSRGSNMISPNSQTGGFRGGAGQMRGYGNQDIRSDDRTDRHSVTLPQRPLGGDELITLGPQGGLARGMSSRGQPSGLNGYGDRSGFGQQREDFGQRYGNQERFGGPSYEQSSMQERSSYRNVDRGYDRQVGTSPNTQIRPPILAAQPLPPATPLEKVWPEERLRDKSLIAIKEFYSAKDEKELGLCVKELNDASFYPSMVALWITDSFERKDMERDSLAKLLVSLSKRDGILTQDHLIKGFESVLAGLEDAVNDAPKAAEFLGRIFARVIIENVIQLKITEQLIFEGGEETGQLVEVGLAADVLGIVLETIESEKGESVVKEMRSRSNLGLENFRPKGSKKTWRLDKFI
jgi:translation initiation factor 4G